MSNQGQANGANTGSEASEVHDEESVKQIRQVFDNVAIVRRVYYAHSEDKEKTREYFYDRIGLEHARFIDALIDHVEEQINFTKKKYLYDTRTSRTHTSWRTSRHGKCKRYSAK